MCQKKNAQCPDSEGFGNNDIGNRVEEIGTFNLKKKKAKESLGEGALRKGREMSSRFRILNTGI